MLEEQVMNNYYYARFDTHSHHCCREKTLKCKLLIDIFVQAIRVCNVGRGHQDTVHDGRVYRHVWHSQPSLQQRKTL